MLRAMAIQLHEDGRVYTPADARYDWLMAKIALSIADSDHHEMVRPAAGTGTVHFTACSCGALTLPYPTASGGEHGVRAAVPGKAAIQCGMFRCPTSARPTCASRRLRSRPAAASTTTTRCHTCCARILAS